MPDPLDYKAAGLDLDVYEDTIGRIGRLVKKTHGPGVLDGFGGFASLFALDVNRWLFSGGYRKPVLVTCTDGVGTKLKVAAQVQKFDTVGIDLVAMSVNDLVCTGGEPLLFLDYLAMPADDKDLTLQLVKGISDGCKEANCSLVGGETAILPDFYAPGDFDMAGFCTGIVERDRVVDGREIQAGDALVGLAASGLHSNGYSLVRKIVFEAAKLAVADVVPELSGPVGAALLTPTRIYVKAFRSIVEHYPVKKRFIRGLANITGGGLVDNVSRILPDGKRAVIRRGSWPVPPMFEWLKKLGNVPQAEMDRVFNGGVGFVVVCSPHFAESIVKQLSDFDVPAWVIGEVTDGPTGVEIVG